MALVPLACLVEDGPPVDGTCDENFVCAPNETPKTCPHDCYYPQPTPAATAEEISLRTDMGDIDAEGVVIYPTCTCSLNYRFASACLPSCNDGEQDLEQGESPENCPCDFVTRCEAPAKDCCGNGLCEPGEYQAGVAEPFQTCRVDCHEPTDGTFNDAFCSDSESLDTSPGDCKGCGDGICTNGEYADGKRPLCSRDCDACIEGRDTCYVLNDGNCWADKGETLANSADCAICGDTVVSPGEVCDDGNQDDADGCTNACQKTYCGDGKVQTGEACDDGNTDNTDACLTTCAAALCGDGYLQSGKEVCDDGNAVETDACTNMCMEAVCGDGIVQVEVEACDDGNQLQTDACLEDCTAARCGDGIVQAGVEACDDGNSIETDACRSDCTVIEHRKVFVTTAKFEGNLGGLAGADTKCRAAATAGKLANPNTFKAWLSDGTTGPATRFDTTFAGIYELVDGTIVVSGGWFELIKGSLAHAINQDESGGGATATPWSDTDTEGQPIKGGLHCSAWTINDNTKGSIGQTDATDATWTNFNDESFCSAATRLYCFEDP